jgi:lysophospholipase L1-like esterase
LIQYSCFGDSVSKGIFRVLAKLEPEWESYHPSNNEGGGCGNTLRGKDCTPFWLQGLNASVHAPHWDVITVNFGLHDLANDTEHVSISDYKANLRNITKTLLAYKEKAHEMRELALGAPLHTTPEAREAAIKAGKPRIFWLSSTPVPNIPLSPPRAQADVPLYNAAAKEVMDGAGIPIVDLYSFVIKNCGGDPHYKSCAPFQQAKGVHFAAEGYEAMAEFIRNSTIITTTSYSAD